MVKNKTELYVPRNEDYHAREKTQLTSWLGCYLGDFGQKEFFNENNQKLLVR